MPANLSTVRRGVGRRVAELRAEIGLTQAQLAEKAGKSLRYIQSVEAGAENLGLDSLVGLANLLRVSLARLFSRPRTMRARRGRPRSRHR